VILIILSAGLGLICCNQMEKPPIQNTGGKIPDSVLEKATIVMTSSGLRQAVILADTLYVFEKEDSTSAQNLKVDFYNAQGQYQSTLTALKGLVRQKLQVFSVWGNVVVANDTSRLETDSLNWDAKRNLITTDDFVRFQRNKDVITGYGIEADNRLDNVRILHDVKGHVNEIPRSEKELDSLDKSPISPTPINPSPAESTRGK
jgi:LPS export ABC transporter protein LptC